MSDRETDRQTDGQTDIMQSHGKNEMTGSDVTVEGRVFKMAVDGWLKALLFI